METTMKTDLEDFRLETQMARRKLSRQYAKTHQRIN